MSELASSNFSRLTALGAGDEEDKAALRLPSWVVALSGRVRWRLSLPPFANSLPPREGPASGDAFRAARA